MSEFSRRTMLRNSAMAAAGGAALLGLTTNNPAGLMAVGSAAPGSSSGQWFMPAETARHARTFMAWPPLGSVWTGEDGPAVQDDIAAIARAIADFEPVVILAEPAEVDAAQQACGSGVEVVPIPTDDLWMRDTGPTFVLGPGGLAGVDLHFNGWGNKQPHGRDGLVASSLLARMGTARIDAAIVGEGGSIEVDGEGTLMATESSLVNANRNPGKSRDEIERALKDCTGASKVIWVKGVAGQDITDFHIDALARFAEHGVVLMSQPPEGDNVWTRAYDQALGVFQNETDARGRRLEIIDLPEPDPRNLGDRGEDFLGSYVNYYVVNGGVIMPRFGDRAADDVAKGIVADLHPGRTVVQMDIDTIAEGGGGIHCATQQEPAV
ncbi:agmatine deiminase family protein [Nocardia sp. NPDC058176]|uniref:agmatine deiminase family protein n=1 Tax=Nocardia sp. NPDC058176 TaxID=3346368 RepID=UPI0036D79858